MARNTQSHIHSAGFIGTKIQRKHCPNLPKTSIDDVRGGAASLAAVAVSSMSDILKAPYENLPIDGSVLVFVP